MSKIPLCRRLHWFAAIALLSLALLARAGDETQIKVPPRIAGTTLVSAERLIELVNTMPDLVLIDARIEMDRRQGYIETSVSLPDVDTDCDSLAEHIPTKRTNVLFYCNGVKCGRSANSARTALGCGYENIYWFRGGIEQWKAKELPLVVDQ